MRTERDKIGELEVPENALYGINALRAKNNFPVEDAFSLIWYKSVGKVKLAVYLTVKKYYSELRKRYPERKSLIKISDDVLDKMIKASEEVAEGKHFEHFIVPSIQGGAGTSINMNVNEIIANRALLLSGYKPGNYDKIDPFEEANIFQSTNDVIPTALKVAVMKELEELEEEINNLRFPVEKIEKKHRDDLRIGYTQMQEAVPVSFGKLFSAYNDALSRDWWRVSKCFERIKQINLGGNAVGSGLTVPRFVIMEAAGELKKITKLPVNRSENMYDNTSNLDSFTEIHATLKAHAVNLEKISNDLRLLSSDISAGKNIKIPPVQTGSSVMPGKVNPVITEFVISAVNQVYSNDMLISSLTGKSLLELNPYLPVIGDKIIDSLKLLKNANISLRENLIDGLKINVKEAYNDLINSASVTTALIPYIGYHKASEIAEIMKNKNIDVFSAGKSSGYISEKQVNQIVRPDNLLKLGFSVKDLIAFEKNE